MQLNRVNRSFPDRTVLWKALQLQCTLLTCDNKLRKEAIDQGLEVHGSFWVVIQLVENGIIAKARGIELLQLMKKINTRLPHSEIDRQINRLK